MGHRPCSGDSFTNILPILISISIFLNLFISESPFSERYSFVVFPFAIYGTNPLFPGLRHVLSNSIRSPQSDRGGRLKGVARASPAECFHLIKYPPRCCGKCQTRVCTYDPTSFRLVVSPRCSLVLLWFKGNV
jgi:hypothetical protein